MTSDQQSAGRTPRWFRGGLRVAAVGSALCLAAGMGLSMASQASAAVKQPHPSFKHVLPVCISFGGILRLALPFSTCNGPIVPLEIAGDEDNGGPPSPPPPPVFPHLTFVHTSTSAPAAVAATTLTANAMCGAHEVATGGGFQVNGPAVTTAVVNASAPTTNGTVSVGGQIPNDWFASIAVTGATVGVTTITAYAVCQHV